MTSPSVFKSAQGRGAILAVYGSLLQRATVPLEEIRLATRCGETFVIASGEKGLPPLILLHGSSSNAAMWLADLAAYAQHFRVYAIDVPGEPGRSAEFRPNLKTAAYVDWMEDVLEGLAIEKAAFVGISLGGWLALKFAAIHSDRVDRLALLCPAGIGPQKIAAVFQAMLLKPFGKRGEEKAIKKIMGVPQLSDETVEYCRLISRHFSPIMEQIPMFSDDQLRCIACPALVIAGGRDVLIYSNQTIQRATNLLPQVRTVFLPGAGHGLIDQKDRILSFLLETHPS